MSQAAALQRSSRSSAGERRRPRVGAFFDMDKTIISENSGSIYMKYRYERGEIDGWDLVKGIGAYLQYKLGVLDILTWTKAMMAEFKGRSEESLVAVADRLFEEMILPSVYPEARRHVEWHHAQGHEVCIVSGAARFLAEPLARHLGVKHLVYTRLEVEDGRFTGRVIEPICFGEGKVYWLQQFIEDEGIELSKSYFYTDSITDMPLLDLVGHPMVVNPDPILYRMAVRRHWSVRFFDAPEGSSDDGCKEADAADATSASS
jgi:putative phosphoserine phosphatase/1-acylglycerol-3-phosphate O-acyltransferase